MQQIYFGGEKKLMFLKLLSWGSKNESQSRLQKYYFRSSFGKQNFSQDKFLFQKRVERYCKCQNIFVKTILIKKRHIIQTNLLQKVMDGALDLKNRERKKWEPIRSHGLLKLIHIRVVK